MKKRWIGAALASVLVAQTASAQAVTGNLLLSLLQSRDKAALFAGSVYVIGFNDGIAAAEAESMMKAGKAGPRPYCVPSSATNEQQIDIVKQYLTYHPSERHMAGAALMSLALREAWPCPQ